MRKLFCAFGVFGVLFAALACQKPYETVIELGVDHEKIEIPSSAAGHCYISVFSRRDWTIGLEPSETWAILDASKGSGTAYVRMDYQENLSGSPRSLEVVVRGGEKVCRIVVNQSATR